MSAPDIVVSLVPPPPPRFSCQGGHFAICNFFSRGREAPAKNFGLPRRYRDNTIRALKFSLDQPCSNTPDEYVFTLYLLFVDRHRHAFLTSQYEDWEFIPRCACIASHVDALSAEILFLNAQTLDASYKYELIRFELRFVDVVERITYEKEKSLQRVSAWRKRCCLGSNGSKLLKKVESC